MLSVIGGVTKQDALAVFQLESDFMALTYGAELIWLWSGLNFVKYMLWLLDSALHGVFQVVQYNFLALPYWLNVW